MEEVRTEDDVSPSDARLNSWLSIQVDAPVAAPLAWFLSTAALVAGAVAEMALVGRVKDGCTSEEAVLEGEVEAETTVVSARTVSVTLAREVGSSVTYRCRSALRSCQRTNSTRGARGYGERQQGSAP